MLDTHVVIAGRQNSTLFTSISRAHVTRARRSYHLKVPLLLLQAVRMHFILILHHTALDPLGASKQGNLGYHNISLDSRCGPVSMNVIFFVIDRTSLVRCRKHMLLNVIAAKNLNKSVRMTSAKFSCFSDRWGWGSGGIFVFARHLLPPHSRPPLNL